MNIRMNIDLIANDTTAQSFMNHFLVELQKQNELLRKEYERAVDHIKDLEDKIEEMKSTDFEIHGIADYQLRQITSSIEEAIQDAIGEAASSYDEEVTNILGYIDTFEPNEDFLPPGPFVDS